MKRFILTAFFAVMFLTVFSQENAGTEAIKERLSSDAVAQLTAAEEQSSKADNILEKCAEKQAQADKLKSQAAGLAKGKAKKLLKQAETIETPLIAQKNSAYDLYEKSNATTYGIYASDIKELMREVSDKKKTAAQSLTNDATSVWTTALENRKKVPSGKNADQKQVLKIKEEVSRQQSEAISLQIQTYAVLLGWYDKPEPKENQQVATGLEDIDEEPVEVEKTEKIIFKVQIAADVVPLSLKKLRDIYPSKEIINNEVDDGIYRYSVGYYNTYEEAAVAIKKMGVKGAFVIAYRNGKRVFNINEIVPKE